MKVKFLIFLQIPLFFHDTDGVKKKEGKGNIKLSFVWLLGEEKIEKVKKVESTQHNNFLSKISHSNKKRRCVKSPLKDLVHTDLVYINTLAK